MNAFTPEECIDLSPKINQINLKLEEEICGINLGLLRLMSKGLDKILNFEYDVDQLDYETITMLILCYRDAGWGVIYNDNGLEKKLRLSITDDDDD